MEIGANGRQEWILKWLTLQNNLARWSFTGSFEFCKPLAMLGERGIGYLGVQLHLAQYQGIIRAADSDYKLFIKKKNAVLFCTLQTLLPGDLWLNKGCRLGATTAISTFASDGLSCCVVNPISHVNSFRSHQKQNREQCERTQTAKTTRFGCLGTEVIWSCWHHPSPLSCFPSRWRVLITTDWKVEQWVVGGAHQEGRGWSAIHWGPVSHASQNPTVDLGSGVSVEPFLVGLFHAHLLSWLSSVMTGGGVTSPSRQITALRCVCKWWCACFDWMLFKSGGLLQAVNHRRHLGFCERVSLYRDKIIRRWAFTRRKL